MTSQVVSNSDLKTTAPHNGYIFDPVVNSSEKVLADPYPTLNSMRDMGSVLWSPQGNQWLVLGYEEASTMLRSKSFGKRLVDNWKHPSLMMRGAMKLLRRGATKSMLLTDPPDHTRIRSLVSAAFTPRSIHMLEDRIEDISNQLVDNLESVCEKESEADLISHFSFPLPVIVIAELLGVPPADRDQFKKWSSKITLSLGGASNPLKILDSFFAMSGLRNYLRRVIEKKRRHPEDDLLSAMVQAQLEDDDRLSNEELLANAILILIAGHETTVNLIGNGVFTLLSHPEQLQKMKNEPALIPHAVEEILRYDPPVQIVRRLALEESEMSGHIIRPDDALTVLIASCNRDPSVTEQPDCFDIERDSIKHITFGAGIHYCLGAELARTEARIAFGCLFQRLPGLRLCDRPLQYKNPFSLRGFKQLPVAL